MMDEGYFDEKFAEILDSYYSVEPEGPCPDAIKTLRQIALDARREKLEECVAAAKEYGDLCLRRGVFQVDELVAAIRATGE